MRASEEIKNLIWKVEDARSYEEGMHYSLLAIAKMEFYLNKDKLDTIEVE